MNEELNNVAITSGKTLNLIDSIKGSHPKRRSFYICKQGGIKRDIKKDDKDVDYLKDDGLSGFSIKEGFTFSDRERTESKYCKIVRALAQCEVLECKSWAVDILASDFMHLKRQDSFWLNEAFRVNLIRVFINAEETQFIVSTPASYHQNASTSRQKMSEHEVQVEQVFCPRVNVKEGDGIMIDGLNQSLVSYLKTNATNNYVYKYHDLSAREHCRVATTINNVLDIDDIFKNEQWYELTKSQASETYEMFAVNSLQFDCITRNTSVRDILHNAHKNWKATADKLLKKIMKTSDIEKTAVYTISWNLIKLHVEKVNILFYLFFL